MKKWAFRLVGVLSRLLLVLGDGLIRIIDALTFNVRKACNCSELLTAKRSKQRDYGKLTEW